MNSHDLLELIAILMSLLVFEMAVIMGVLFAATGD